MKIDRTKPPVSQVDGNSLKAERKPRNPLVVLEPATTAPHEEAASHHPRGEFGLEFIVALRNLLKSSVKSRLETIQGAL